MLAKPIPARGRSGGPRRAGRLALGALLAAAVLAAGGHALLWLWLCGRLEAGLDAWTAARRAEGWRVAHGAPRRGGWPFTAALTVPEFRLQGGAGLLPGGVDWRPDTLVLRVAPPRLDRLAVEAPGRHRLRLGGAALPFTAGRLSLALPIEGDAAPREAAAAAGRLRFDTPAGVVEVRAASLDFGTRGRGADGGGPGTSLRVSAADVALPPDLPGTARLGRAVERVGLDLLLTGSVPPGRDPARRAAAWRDGGGALEVRALDLGWGEVATSASATLALDGALQPAGTGALRLTGGEALLDAAGDAGLLSPFGAAAARIGLRALGRAQPQEGGGPARTELPLALRDRSLSLGGVPLARLPALDWGVAGPGVDSEPAPPRD